MSEILIYRAKPNPAGKDKNRNTPIARQLLGEWVDVLNQGSRTIHLGGVTLGHTQFGFGCSDPKTATYWQGTESIALAPREVVRIHTGKSVDRVSMATEDQLGANQHAFAESGLFVLNNDCGDAVSLWLLVNNQWQKLDGAAYGPRPAEGAVLQRIQDRLI